MRNTLPPLLAACAGAWLLAGCAGVTITEADDKTAATIPVRLPESYLLVTFPAEAEKPATAQIVVLPTGKELRLKPRPGLGSANLQFVLTNGALSSWGLATDSKVPETITAATGLLAQLKMTETRITRGDKERVFLYRIIPAANGGKPRFELVLPD